MNNAIKTSFSAALKQSFYQQVVQCLKYFKQEFIQALMVAPLWKYFSTFPME